MPLLNLQLEANRLRHLLPIGLGLLVANLRLLAKTPEGWQLIVELLQLELEILHRGPGFTLTLRVGFFLGPLSDLLPGEDHHLGEDLLLGEDLPLIVLLLGGALLPAAGPAQDAELVLVLVTLVKISIEGHLLGAIILGVDLRPIG